jgi:FtsH-binding integral membrane protein
MRLWLKDSERRPDPAPVKTDDRKAVLTGIALWIVALVVVLVAVVPLDPQSNLWLVYTCVIGIVLGAVGLVYTHARRHKA